MLYFSLEIMPKEEKENQKREGAANRKIGKMNNTDLTLPSCYQNNFATALFWQ